MGVDALSAAKLAIYIVLIQPSFYTLWKHGRTGLLGWFYLNAFCVLRIVTDAMTLHPNTGTATLILASIGLAPLLFATAGILHEARLAREPGINNKIEWILQLQFHAIVIAGVVLVIIGVVNIEGKSNLTETKLHTNQHLVEAGAGVMVVAWLALVLWSLWSTRLRATADVPSFRGGTILLHAVIATLVFNGVRLVYAITSLILRITHPDSGFLTSTAASVCLSVVPEMLVVIIFLVGGLRTRNLRKTMKTMNKYTAQPLQTGMQPMPAQYNAPQYQSNQYNSQY